MIQNLRIIPRIDIKSDRLIKSINFDGMRDLGNANFFSKKYYNEGADELLIIDLGCKSIWKKINCKFFKKLYKRNIYSSYIRRRY